MPIYEYRCLDCDDELEVMQKITAGPLRKCRKCSGRLQKQVSRTSFQLKGGGWFASGYGDASGDKNKKKKTAKTDKTSTSKPAAKSSEKSESSGKSELKSASA